MARIPDGGGVKAQAAIDKAEGHPVQQGESDPVRVGLLISNAIAAACFGPRGEWREQEGG